MESEGNLKEWMTTTEATTYLGISTKTMSRLIRDGRLVTYEHPLDRRKKLVRSAEVQQLRAEAERMAA